MVATLLFGVCVGTADAGSGRKVAIESEPAGASVYLNEKEAGPACPSTPCTIEAPAGEVTIIIELKDHASSFQEVLIPKRGRVPKVMVKLLPAVGTIVVDGPAGANVQVDEEDKGNAPVRIDVNEDAHHVVVTQNGKTLYDQFVDVTTGGETTVTPKQVATGGGTESTGDGEGEDTSGGDVVKSATPKRPRDRFISASAAVDIGFRTFTYQDVETPQKLRDEKEGGQVLAGPLIEFWPGELAGIDPLRGLSILARLQFGVNSQAVSGNGIMDKTNTFWQSMEFSLRYRKKLAGRFTAEAGIGYVRDQYQFEGNTQDLKLVPDVDYQSIRLGLRASVLLGPVEPYLTIENRVVTDGGKLAERFAEGTDASGYRFGAGINARKGNFVGRFELSALQYNWDIQFDPAAEFRATGASDSIRQIQIALGYQY